MGPSSCDRGNVNLLSGGIKRILDLSCEAEITDEVKNFDFDLAQAGRVEYARISPPELVKPVGQISYWLNELDQLLRAKNASAMYPAKLSLSERAEIGQAKAEVVQDADEIMPKFSVERQLLVIADAQSRLRNRYLIVLRPDQLDTWLLGRQKIAPTRVDLKTDEKCPRPASSSTLDF